MKCYSEFRVCVLAFGMYFDIQNFIFVWDYICSYSGNLGVSRKSKVLNDGSLFLATQNWDFGADFDSEAINRGRHK